MKCQREDETLTPKRTTALPEHATTCFLRLEIFSTATANTKAANTIRREKADACAILHCRQNLGFRKTIPDMVQNHLVARIKTGVSEYRLVPQLWKMKIYYFDFNFTADRGWRCQPKAPPSPPKPETHNPVFVTGNQTRHEDFQTIHNSTTHRLRWIITQVNKPPTKDKVTLAGSGTVMMVRARLFRVAGPPPELKSAINTVHTPFPSVF